jgi:nicotinamidase/pyrazinamidase
VMDSWGAELHPQLKIQGDVIRKGTGGEDGYSGFTLRDPESGEEDETALESALRERGIERAVVVGLATDYCVKATAIDATDKGFDTTVLSHAIRAVNREPGDDDRAIQEMRAAGARIE